MNLKKLKKGDTIGFYSPSSPATNTAPKRFQRAKEYLKKKGFNLLAGRLTGKRDFYRSGNIKDRAKELNELIRNPEIKCIMSVIGGTNSNSILPYIDYEAFKKNPKIMIGYSDVTAILLAIYAKTGIKTFYGPALIPSFGEFPPFVHETYNYFSDILIEEQSFPYIYEQPKCWTDEHINWEEKEREKVKNKNEWITVNKGKVVGRVIGGNLNAMTGIWNSQYMPKIKKGDILFIEDTMKTASHMEKLFLLLRVSGVFDKISGIVLGKHELFDDQGTDREPYEILEEVLRQKDIPFLAKFDCCHTHPMFTLPIGSKIELDVTNKKVSILDSPMG
ncbi:LD-carboxypeptidase [Halanaerocella petrolearia]